MTQVNSKHVKLASSNSKLSMVLFTLVLAFSVHIIFRPVLCCEAECMAGITKAFIRKYSEPIRQVFLELVSHHSLYRLIRPVWLTDNFKRMRNYLATSSPMRRHIKTTLSQSIIHSISLRIAPITTQSSLHISTGNVKTQLLELIHPAARTLTVLLYAEPQVHWFITTRIFEQSSITPSSQTIITSQIQVLEHFPRLFPVCSMA
jgi:hypothetical protein